MRLFLYEFITGGGLIGETPPGSLLREGRAMIAALAADACAIPNAEVHLLWDARLPTSLLPAEVRPACLHPVASPAAAAAEFSLQAAQAEGTIVIAPETAGHLLGCVETVLAAGGRLLGPAPEIVALCGHKHETAKLLAAAGVPTPHGMLLEPGETLPETAAFPYPAVLKPVDGCGSLGVRFLADRQSCQEVLERTSRLEQFVAGKPGSVAALCGPEQIIALPACRQHLSADGDFAYEGGSLPLPPDQARRAEQLARISLAALPQPLGYLGVDMILGEAADGSRDAVIEINPRLTTSYVGLRRATKGNLCQAMLQVLHGEAVDLTFGNAPLEFLADGTVR